MMSETKLKNKNIKKGYKPVIPKISYHPLSTKNVTQRSSDFFFNLIAIKVYKYYLSIKDNSIEKILFINE